MDLFISIQSLVDLIVCANGTAATYNLAASESPDAITCSVVCRYQVYKQNEAQGNYKKENARKVPAFIIVCAGRTGMDSNLEVRKEFRRMIQNWFKKSSVRYNDFIKALLANNVGYMNQYMNNIASAVFSSFDTGNHPSEHTEPERFYHGFVLGLIVDAKLDYIITSNRESGLGRYDVIMEPRDGKGIAFVFEFKVKNLDLEETLEATVQNALKQIEDKNYDAMLFDRGFVKEQIRHYGFAFEGKKVLIG